MTLSKKILNLVCSCCCGTPISIKLSHSYGCIAATKFSVLITLKLLLFNLLFYSFTGLICLSFNNHSFISLDLIEVHMFTVWCLISNWLQNGYPLKVWIQLTPPTPGGGTWNYSHNASLGPPPLSSSYLGSSSILPPPLFGEVLHFSSSPFLGGPSF